MSQALPPVTRLGDRIAIVGGSRMPFARQAIVFHDIPAVDLGKMVAGELLARNEVPAGVIEQLVFGQVAQMPEAPNIVHGIMLGTGTNMHTDVHNVSRVCAANLQAVANVARNLMARSIHAGTAGGVDSSSVLPTGVSKKLVWVLVDVNRARVTGRRLKLFPRLRLHDLMPVPPAVAEYSAGLHMGDTAEQMTKAYGTTREQRDALVHHFHQRVAQTQAEGKLAGEVMTIHAPPSKNPLSEDSNIRDNSTLADYAKLRPAFDRKRGTVTAINNIPLTDSTTAVVTMTESRVKELGPASLRYLRSFAFTIIDV